jgi:hypothetical protein
MERPSSRGSIELLRDSLHKRLDSALPITLGTIMCVVAFIALQYVFGPPSDGSLLDNLSFAQDASTGATVGFLGASALFLSRTD